ncbi:MAG: polyprenyl synthetase family protein [Anaerolineales bacterium]|nr:polyprenyl synthetase family protein [Anaerolineales bacterium]MCB9171637.1 polyprenyl synthetase family protein [Ardenticatenales bacterium]
MSQLHTLLEPYSNEIGRALHTFIRKNATDGARLWDAVAYHLGWVDEEFQPSLAPKGKRIRSALCLMACEAVGGQWEMAIPGAMAVELVHEFSLVHDDIQDADRLRRHRPTLWAVIGQPQAITAGDALFALAQLALFEDYYKDVPLERQMLAARRLNEATIALAEGQHLDLSFEGRDEVDPADYLRMIRGKTASLLAASAEIGGVLALASLADCAALHAMGLALGMAFQMQDDLLGLWGDPARTGKAVGADLRAGKKSLPVSYALTQPNSDRLRELYRAPLSNDSEVDEALRLIERSGAQRYARRLMDDYYAAARHHLHSISAAAGRRAPLETVIDLLEIRDH